MRLPRPWGGRLEDMSSHEQRRQVTVRTTPKLVPFLVAGLAVAFTAAVITVYSTAPAENYSRPASLGYMTFVYCLPALALSATAWLATEKVLRRRASTYDITPAERK